MAFQNGDSQVSASHSFMCMLGQSMNKSLGNLWASSKGKMLSDIQTDSGPCCLGHRNPMMGKSTPYMSPEPQLFQVY